MKSHFGMSWNTSATEYARKHSVPCMTDYPIDGFGKRRDTEIGKEILGIEVCKTLGLNKCLINKRFLSLN